jgi:hypothetical protein
MGGLFRLLNVTIVDFFYYLLLLKLLYVSVYVLEYILANIFLTEDGRTTETCSRLSNNIFCDYLHQLRRRDTAHITDSLIPLICGKIVWLRSLKVVDVFLKENVPL